MQKRVHFAPTNTVFSTSRTPSPAFSDASQPSDDSSEVSTPPPEQQYPRTPFPHDLILQNTSPQIFYQPQQQQEVVPKEHMHVHYLLAYNPSVEIPIFLDLSRPTKQVYGLVETHELNEAATSPPLQSLIITCPTLAWEITVTPIPTPSTPPTPPMYDDDYSLTPSPSLPRPDYVTVNDVLYHLFRQLRSPVTREEYDSLAIGPDKHAVDSAYRTRCARIPDPVYRDREEGKGVKRIDFLHDTVVFRGLSWTSMDPRVWELNVTTLPQTGHSLVPLAISASTASVA